MTSWRPKVNKFYRINQQIRANQVRAIDEESKQVGIITLSEALKAAQEKSLDLVEIAPNANPPVVKIIDYKKFKYLEEKKQKEARKHTKATELKEVRFSPFIGEHDLETGLKKTRIFLSEGNIVKISIVFKGRQMVHREFGPKLLTRILETLGETAEVEREGRFEGRRFVSVIKSTRKQPKQESINSKQDTLKTKGETTKDKTQTDKKNEAKN